MLADGLLYFGPDIVVHIEGVGPVLSGCIQRLRTGLCSCQHCLRMVGKIRGLHSLEHYA